MKKLLAILTVTILTAGVAALACGEKAAVAGCPKSAESVERVVTMLDDGIRIMLASNDSAMVEQIQATNGRCKSACHGECPMSGEAVNRVVEKTDRGVVITATSTDSSTVKALQEYAGGGGEGCSKKKAAQQASNDGGCSKNKADAAARVAANR
jgi:TusA-related sulfurtransferase